MSDHKKDVTVFVTGVSMSGGVKNDSNRTTPEDKKESEGEKARDSRSDDWRSSFWLWIL